MFWGWPSGRTPVETGAEDGGRSGDLGQSGYLFGEPSSPAADLDDRPLGPANQLGRLGQPGIVRRLQGGVNRPDRQGVQPNPDLGLLGVDRQDQVKGTGLKRMEHRRPALAEGLPKGLGGVQGVGPAHQGGHPAEQTLFRFGRLLHVVAFAPAGLVAQQVIDPHPVGRGGQGPGHGLQGPRADGGDDRARFAVDPTQGGRGVGHLDLVATLPGPDQSGPFVDPQHLGHTGGAVPEQGQELGHPLAHQPQDQRLGQGQGKRRFQRPGFKDLLQAAALGQPTGPFGRGYGDGPRLLVLV